MARRPWHDPEFTFLSDVGFSFEGDGHAFKLCGFLGSADGHVASLALVAPDGTPRDLPSKVPYAKVKAGDSLISTGPCGGGYGPAFARDPEHVLSDVLDGRIPASTATRDYGVVIENG